MNTARQQEVAPGSPRMLRAAALYVVAFAVTLAALGIYGRAAVGPPRPHAAAAFLIVPFASLVLIALTAAAGRVTARGRSAGPPPIPGGPT